MRFVFYFLLMISQNISCKAQTLPLNTLEHNNGAYLKDLDDIFPFWVGSWKGTSNNKEYTFQFTIFNHQLINYFDNEYYSDMLMIKFKVKNLNTNEIIYDDTNISSFENYKIRYLAHISSDYFFHFKDNGSNCYNNVEFTLSKNNNNPNQIQYKDFKYGNNIYLDCQYTNQEEIPMFLPKVDLVLTRQ